MEGSLGKKQGEWNNMKEKPNLKWERRKEKYKRSVGLEEGTMNDNDK